ncbi:enoyl-CoA hydratase/isomerase family protein [Haloechinothrix salitolerans]|uniref:Enoyl-CoA hydratase/isomerase family protein n=1 Tax=Haloechinothrix salitolerans TaxID=926830 RepID=A0ABW2BYW3_9PSEU
MDLSELKLETVAVDRPHETVAVATINRPDAMNAMTDAMFTELEELATAVDDDDTVRALILTGAGDKAFCAGYDLAAADTLPSLGALGMLELQERAARSIAAIRSVRVPVIAAVNGAAAGGGLAIALAADIRLAAPSAKFNCAMVRIGLHAGDLGISWMLSRLVGHARAAEVSYTGRPIDADEAERTGLVNHVVPADALLGEARALADAIAANSPGGVQLSKRALYANLEVSSFGAALELENRGQALLTRTEDMVEALTALGEHRAPHFTGR